MGSRAAKTATGGIDREHLAHVEQQVLRGLRSVEDPELPISILDLGMVRGVKARSEDGEVVVRVEVVPTFLGCPAQMFIEADIGSMVGQVAGVDRIEVDWLSDQDWSVEDLTEMGRDRLRSLGIATPRAGAPLSCPHCASLDVAIESDWGSSLCRKMAYCRDCRTPFDVMKSASSREQDTAGAGSGGQLVTLSSRRAMRG